MNDNNFLKYAKLENSKKISKTRKIMGLVILAVVLLVGCVAIPKKVESAFFYPDSINYGGTPKNQNLTFENVIFPSKDGTMLHGWFVPAERGAKNAWGTILYFHGNGSNITDHWNFTYWLPGLGYNVFIFDYRGYGESHKITPTFKGVIEDSESALAYVRSRADIDSQKLLILGQSLGGTMAITTVGSQRKAGEPKNGICGMVIDSTFSSFQEIANDKIPYAGFLINNEYSADHYVKNLNPIPLLFIHGSADKVIPMKHSEQLYALANEPKELIIAEDLEHIMAISDHGSLTNHYQNKMVAFFGNAIKTCNE